MAKRGFRTERQRNVAALLRNKPMSASELLEVIACDKTTLRRGLDSLKEQGLLDYVPSPVARTAPGRKAGLWSLTEDGQRAAITDAGTSQAFDIEDGAQASSAVRVGYTLVSASMASGPAKDMMAVLADGEFTAATSWVARIDGNGQGYLFAFDPSLGDQPVENLRAALEEIGAVCHVSAVRAVQRPDEFVRSVRTARSAAKRAVARRDT